MEEEKSEFPDSRPEIVCNDPNEVLKGNSLVYLVVNELVKNCAEGGATEIIVTAERGRVVVKDNVPHDDPGPLLENLNRERPESHKTNEQRVIKNTPGGVGIRWCRGVLQTLLHEESDLRFEATKGGKIQAIITWPTS